MINFILKSVDIKKNLDGKGKSFNFWKFGNLLMSGNYGNVGNSGKIGKLGNFGVFRNFETLEFLGTDRIKQETRAKKVILPLGNLAKLVFCSILSSKN